MRPLICDFVWKCQTSAGRIRFSYESLIAYPTHIYPALSLNLGIPTCVRVMYASTGIFSRFESGTVQPSTRCVRNMRRTCAFNLHICKSYSRATHLYVPHIQGSSYIMYYDAKLIKKSRAISFLTVNLFLQEYIRRREYIDCGIFLRQFLFERIDKICAKIFSLSSIRSFFKSSRIIVK